MLADIFDIDGCFIDFDSNEQKQLAINAIDDILADANILAFVQVDKEKLERHLRFLHQTDHDLCAYTPVDIAGAIVGSLRIAITKLDNEILHHKAIGTVNNEIGDLVANRQNLRILVNHIRAVSWVNC